MPTFQSLGRSSSGAYAYIYVSPLRVYTHMVEYMTRLSNRKQYAFCAYYSYTVMFKSGGGSIKELEQTALEDISHYNSPFTLDEESTRFPDIRLGRHCIYTHRISREIRTRQRRRLQPVRMSPSGRFLDPRAHPQRDRRVCVRTDSRSDDVFSPPSASIAPNTL
ncbi:hypothetical protein Trydic_g9204 [Trypoxylus dichotomus]